jgi:predicted dithiol-disulfide oxidoreductase (DUF899 family)
VGKRLPRVHSLRGCTRRSLYVERAKHNLRGNLPGSTVQVGAYKALRGWTLPWYSSFDSDFNYDFHVTLDEAVAPREYNYRSAAELDLKYGEDSFKGEQPGLSVFFRLDDDLFHTYSTYGRGTESLNDSYSHLDTTPYGRQEDFEDSPPGWPQKKTYG